MGIIYGLLIIMLILKVLFNTNWRNDTAQFIDEYEKNRPNYNQYRILPHDVKELDVIKLDDGRFRINFTPIKIEQVEEFYFNIGIKSKHTSGEIAFSFILNNNIQLVEESGSNEEIECIVIALDTNSVSGDRLLLVLANLFGIELGNKTQIVKSTILLCAKQQINYESLFTDREFICFFSDTSVGAISPKLKIGLNLEKGIFFLEEIDPIYRPILIKRLTFVPNIKK